MEEILSSIRRVIARDEDARGGAASAKPASSSTAASVADDEEDDVLELSEDATFSAEGESDEPIHGLVHSQVMVQPDRVDGSDPQNVAAPVTAESLLSSASEHASRQSLDALNAVLTTGRDPTEDAASASAGDVTVNAMVESLLRPMLRQWLDSNLPPLVERLVAREIARITGNRL